MDTKTTISSTEARKNLSEVIDRVDKTGVRYTLTVNGKPRVVMINAEEFESWEETLEIMSDPKLYRRLLRLKNTPYRAEDYVTLDKIRSAKR